MNTASQKIVRPNRADRRKWQKMRPVCKDCGTKVRATELVMYQGHPNHEPCLRERLDREQKERLGNMGIQVVDSKGLFSG